MILLQKLVVRDAYQRDLTPSLIVSFDEDFSLVIKRFANQPEARGIFVADEARHLLGVITRRDLLDWARVKLGSALQLKWSTKSQAFRLITLMHASKAGEVMHSESQRAAVKADDSLAKALQLMIDLDLVVLPVVDDANRIIEDLKLDEILATIAEKEETGSQT